MKPTLAASFLLPCLVVFAGCGAPASRGSAPEARAAETASPSAPDESPPQAIVANDLQNKVLFSAEPLGPKASVASAMDSWTLGEPLYIHFFGPAPKKVLVYAEVNGEAAMGAGVEVLRGARLGALAEIELDGDGKTYPIHGHLGPVQGEAHLGKPSAYYAGVWSTDAPGWARFWQEFHSRLIPMMSVGDNTLKIIVSDEKRKESFGEATLKVQIPDEAALQNDLAQNVQKAAEGDKGALKEIDALARKHPTFAGADIRSIGFTTGKWKLAVDDQAQVISKTITVDVIWRKPNDPFPARCRLIGLTAVRNMQDKSGGKLALAERSVETRWTPCPSGNGSRR